MRNVCLNLVVQTPRSLASPARIEAFCAALGVVDPLFLPKKYGSSEPLKSTFDLAVAPEQLAELHRANGSSMIFAFRPPLEGTMHLNTMRGPRVPSNGLRVLLNYASVEARLDAIEAFLCSMVDVLGAAYACATLSGGSPHVVRMNDPKENWGEINGIEIPPWNPSGLQNLPGIAWINVFGSEYVRFLGGEVLASLPCYRSKALSDGRGFWLQPTKRPEEMFTEAGRELASNIKTRMGRPRAFYGHDPHTPSFQAVYETPPFDFSEIRPSS